MTKDIGKFPGNQEQIGLDEKNIPENHGAHQTVLAGESQERTNGQRTGVFKMAPSRLLAEPTESEEEKGSLDQSRSVDQEKNRDVPMHLPRSQEVLPFGITNKESLAEGPTDQEDLMRPTSSSTTSRENENGEGAEQQPLSKTAVPPRVRQETSGLDSTHRASNATFTDEGKGDFSSTSTDVRHQSMHSSSGEAERYSAALLAIPAVDLEVTLHDTQVAFLSNLHAAVEDIECSEQLRQAAENSVIEGHAGDRNSGEEVGTPFSSAAMYNQSDLEALSWYEKLDSLSPLAAAALSSSNEAPAYRPAKDEWECGAAIGFASPVCIDKFMNHRRSDEYAGYGYGQSVSQFLASRSIDRANARGKAVRNLSGSRRRRVRRELRTVAAEPRYLGFEAFESFVEANSYMLTEDVYSAIDSGTTVSISADGELLMNGFNPKSAVKIVGFNGSMSRSAGSGDIVGFAYSRDERRIPLRVQKVHSVLGAPNDLLSVSAMLYFSLH